MRDCSLPASQSPNLIFMQAIVIAQNQEEREFLSYVLRHSGLSVARTAAVKLILNSLHAHPVDLILFAPGDMAALAAEAQAIREFCQAPL
ncbi:MAG TPA: hypothetical protein PLK31_13300 [Chloroflexota bacterium]|nr:hypothetical protein [Chloroflexota bacterium]